MPNELTLLYSQRIAKNRRLLSLSLWFNIFNDKMFNVLEIPDVSLVVRALKCICWKNDQKWNSWNLAIFGYRRCKQSWIYTVIFKVSIWCGSSWMVSTLASHARGPGFKPRAGHAFLFLSYSQKSDKKWLPAM